MLRLVRLRCLRKVEERKTPVIVAGVQPLFQQLPAEKFLSCSLLQHLSHDRLHWWQQ